MPPRASSSRKRPASPSPDVNADLTAQNQALQEQVKLLKSLYEQSVRNDALTTQRLDRMEADARARGPGSAAAAAPASVNDGEVRRLREQTEGLLKSLAASNEAAEQARVAARKAGAELAVTRAARPTKPSYVAVCEGCYKERERELPNPDEPVEFLRLTFNHSTHTATLDLSPFETMREVRTKLWMLWDLPPCQMRLFYNAERMDPSDIPKDYDMEDGDVVDVVMKMPYF